MGTPNAALGSVLGSKSSQRATHIYVENEDLRSISTELRPLASAALRTSWIFALDVLSVYLVSLIGNDRKHQTKVATTFMGLYITRTPLVSSRELQMNRPLRPWAD